MILKKAFYIDITNFVDTKLNTGIQRVLKEFLYLALKDKKLDINLLYFDRNKNSYILLSNRDKNYLLNKTDSFYLTSKKSIDIFKKTSHKKYFFELDRVWNSKPNRLTLYKKLKKANFYIINYIYDMIPIFYPKYFYKETKNNFPKYIDAILRYSNQLFFDSYSCQKDFLKYKDNQNIKRAIKNSVVHLGCDFKLQNNQSIQTKYTKLLEKRYILFVGTIEPRKKHKELLEVFDKLQKEHMDINLIFIGKFGWNIENIKSKIQNHKELNKTLFHLEDINDFTLSQFYKNAYLVCYLSNYEGFGLPVVEALYNNNIVVVSNNSSLKEAGREFVDYIEENKPKELFKTINSYLLDNNLYLTKKDFVKTNFKAHSWRDFYKKTTKTL